MVTKDGLEPKHGCFGQRATMIAAFFLPLLSSDLPNAVQVHIAWMMVCAVLLPQNGVKTGRKRYALHSFGGCCYVHLFLSYPPSPLICSILLAFVCFSNSSAASPSSTPASVSTSASISPVASFTPRCSFRHVRHLLYPSWRIFSLKLLFVFSLRL